MHGRKIKLISVNDGYEPDRAIAATKKLIEDEKVFALIGPVGTPTSAAAQPLATAAKVPFIGAFTGAGFLRNPKLENVINVRASYDAETEAWVKHLTEDLKISKIGIFYQDDALAAPASPASRRRWTSAKWRSPRRRRMSATPSR